jgi:hypothetical protein
VVSRLSKSLKNLDFLFSGRSGVTSRCAKLLGVNYPALKGAASCFIELASKRAYAISTGVDYSVWAVPALQQIVHSGCLVLATQILSISRNEKKKLSSRNVFQEGRLCFHPHPEGWGLPAPPPSPPQDKRLRVTIPLHDELNVATLNAIVTDIAEFEGMTKEHVYDLLR